uniref:Uncharacterized protein n=1 Tax=Candidatus Kentrum sp. FM TaxID=2126340 RepID=A0A450SXA3_9GAMM|nr:MAG: hypothetical protein BECKFM1743A_GA0114220_102242 [Candidatus Kentron sp. FM]VFJ60368.1 MAG: hypothetical protein BECKFM1743C_GA0114222_102713 [Candidatus Kentron sp. FM]
MDGSESEVPKKSRNPRIKPKLYLEISVISYRTSPASRDVIIAGHQQSTHLFLGKLNGDFEPLFPPLPSKKRI